MRHGITAALLLVLTATQADIAYAQTPTPTTQADSTAIAEAARAFSRAYVTGDSATIASLYTEDALLLPPGRDLRGPDAAARWFYAPPERRPREHHLVSEALRIEGDMASDVGHWSVVTGNGDTFRGRYLVVWQRGEDGRWRMAYDMWHSPPE